MIGSPLVGLDAEPAEQLAGQQPAVGGVGQHVRDDAAEHEALGRVAERVDEPVVPGAAAVDVADHRQPARRRRRRAARRRVAGVVGRSAGKSAPSIAASQTSLVNTIWLEHVGERLLGAVEACTGVAGSRSCAVRPRRELLGAGRAAARVSSRSWCDQQVGESRLIGVLPGVRPTATMGGWKWMPLGAGSQWLRCAPERLGGWPYALANARLKPSTDS